MNANPIWGRLTAKDLHSLLNQQDITDDMMNFYMGLLHQKSESKEWLMMDSFFFEQLFW